MRFDIISLFPEIFTSFLGESLMAKAIAKKIININIINPRDFTADKHKTCDDRPYGGGFGMVLKPEPLALALESLPQKPKSWRIYLSPSGQKLSQSKVCQLAQKPGLTLLCGRYEGVDQRVIDLLIDEEISIGDYVVNGGEVPAMVLIEAVSRLIPGFMGKLGSADEESHQSGLLEYPHYTRPPEFRGLKVPNWLLGGDHAKVAGRRLKIALERTLLERPELLAKANLSAQELKILQSPWTEDDEARKAPTEDSSK